ncbi:two pore potassium channel b-like [Panicum miliaceum]|uniref:Two pore potassium channel b-like n=1 Tax=Panicum miliaceum TaxID=4540 RepID=A0A3L6Q066_PANMI|nr:two pore potassium channel b-like [Panicum miliaceum]
MAENGAKQPLLQDGEPLNAGETRPIQGAGAKRFRRCRTAPSADAAQDSPPGSKSKNPSRQERGSAGSPPFAPPKELLRGARPSLRLVGVLLLAYLLAGTIAFYLAMDHMSGGRTRSRVMDALYFCVVTMTTVGYGDLRRAKLLACAFVFAGVALVGTFLSKAADYLVEKQEAFLFRALHLRRAGDRRALRDMEANKVRYKLYTSAALLAAALASGTAFLVGVEGMRPVDAFYCVCATVTTLGYGDRSFSSMPGRVFAAAWITAADMDGDQRVGAADFVLYNLKELGKISQEEIAEFLEEFDQLDADSSGTLSPHDLIVAQPG